MLERCHALEREATGRRGPASINVNWRKNTNNAKAMIGKQKGGQNRVWCSLPFRGYEKSDSPFNVPQFVVHEMLHTFGYNHGDEMRHLQQLVKSECSHYRWYIVDHPEVAPMIVQGLRADAVEKKPAVKKKAGHKKKL